MDVMTSRKEQRYQPEGIVQVVMDDITDFYPIFADEAQLVITDLEMIDDPQTELLDRGMWAVLKQLGGDPLDPLDGNQIEECVMGEISAITLIAQITASVAEEGPGVQSSFSTYISDGKEYLTIGIKLTRAA